MEKNWIWSTHVGQRSSISNQFQIHLYIYLLCPCLIMSCLMCQQPCSVQQLQSPYLQAVLLFGEAQPGYRYRYRYLYIVYIYIYELPKVQDQTGCFLPQRDCTHSNTLNAQSHEAIRSYTVTSYEINRKLHRFPKNRFKMSRSLGSSRSRVSALVSTSFWNSSAHSLCQLYQSARSNSPNSSPIKYSWGSPGVIAIFHNVRWAK